MVISGKTIDEIDEGKEKEGMKKLEAILFISGRFLSLQELISLSEMSALEISDFIDKLKNKYSSDDYALCIIERNNMWKMDVKPEFSSIVNKIATGSAEFSKAEQETLALIAYKQPIKQSVIIKIRGNKAYDHISKFTDLKLIKKKKMGHTYDLSLSDEFYDYFNVESGNDFLKTSVEEKEEN